MGDFKAPAGQQNKIATPVQAPKEASSLGETEYVDSRASTFQFIQLQAAADDQGKGSRITQLQSKSAQFTGFSRVAQLQAKSYSQVSAAKPSVVQREENKTGLPDGLKSGMESISGMSLSDVKVHRNSDKPAQLQAHAYAQGTDIHLGPGQEKHLPHELGHVVQQKEGRVKPTVQLKDKVNINDDSGLEKEADVLGQKASSVGETTEKGSDVGVAQLQAKNNSQISAAQPPVVQRVGEEDKLNEVSKGAGRDVTEVEIEKVRPIKGEPIETIKEKTGLTLQQIATAQARLFGDVKITKENREGVSELKAATSWEKVVMDGLSEDDKLKLIAAKAKIPAPEEIFTQEAIAKHLGEFAKGAHAFIDPDTSKKITGEKDDPNFKGWGKDANFVAPLEEANKAHQKAKGSDNGIITLEKELSIPNFNWSRSNWNPDKQMWRWTIPAPQNIKLNEKAFLTMATGNETGAFVNDWVAGGFTKGGMTEAVIQVIPRDKLWELIHEGKVNYVIETYEKTPDNIGPGGPGTLDKKDKYYKPTPEEIAAGFKSS